MNPDLKLKVLALGDNMTTQRLKACFGDEPFILVCISQISEAVLHLQRERFDIVLIDSLFEEAYNACARISQIIRVPIALLVRETEVNWKNLGAWNVDGFLPEESSHVELISRIKAIIRRLSTANDAPYLNPAN